MSNNKDQKEKERDAFMALHKPFPITSLCRADLTFGHLRNRLSQSKALKITDTQMLRLAERLADDYCEQLFWTSLEIILEDVLDESYTNHKKTK